MFVLPTLQDNWPLVVPEAMSMGMPILLSQYAGSVPDLIRSGENGYSFDPNKPKELASLMAQYIQERDLILRHGQKSVELVRDYHPTRVAETFKECILSTCLKGRASTM